VTIYCQKHKKQQPALQPLALSVPFAAINYSQKAQKITPRACFGLQPKYSVKSSPDERSSTKLSKRYKVACVVF
jgi:hypothetical protein